MNLRPVMSNSFTKTDLSGITDMTKFMVKQNTEV